MRFGLPAQIYRPHNRSWGETNLWVYFLAPLQVLHPRMYFFEGIISGSLKRMAVFNNPRFKTGLGTITYFETPVQKIFWSWFSWLYRPIWKCGFLHLIPNQWWYAHIFSKWYYSKVPVFNGWKGHTAESNNLSWSMWCFPYLAFTGVGQGLSLHVLVKVEEIHWRHVCELELCFFNTLRLLYFWSFKSHRTVKMSCLQIFEV